MMSPEGFGRTHKRHGTDIIRVALERKGVIGFIDIHETMTLVEARALIWENVENAPQEFQFVLEDGAPVSARQENTQKIAYFYPCVKIRECRKNRMMASPKSPVMTNDGTFEYEVNGRGPNNGSMSEKISVVTTSGEEFSVWVTEDYTFQQLRRDASRYWNLPATQVALTDADGCLWPEQAKILSLMSVEALLQKKIVLEYKVGALGGHGPTTITKKNKKQITRLSQTSSSICQSGTATLGLSSFRSKTAASPTATEQETIANPVEELWRIFTFYCVNGDSLELECIRAHQFNKLLRDSCVFNGSLTPAMVDIIYTAETKGKPQASGKMNFDEFLNALMKIASARQYKPNSSKHLRDSQEEEALFHKLVMGNILPRASRWQTQTWEEHTERLRQPEIVTFISKFLDPLVEIFMFYAKSHVLNATSGVKEFHMSYSDYQRFINDFCFANLQISSVEAAQVFMASCSSPRLHTGLLTSGETDAGSTQIDPADPNGLESPFSLSSTGTAVSVSIQRVLESVEGIVAYAFPPNQVGHMCMGLSAFLDALGRIGITAFSKTKTIKTLHCVKAVFHHLSRGLTRSRVLEILQNHGTASIHATKFYSGTVAFNNKFLDMWRYEGSPDYLTGCIVNFPTPSKDSSSILACGGRGSASSGTSAGVMSNVITTFNASLSNPLSSRSPGRRSASVASLFDERSSLSGAGRGREALDRLMRNAFLRNTMLAANDRQQKENATQPPSTVVIQTASPKSLLLEEPTEIIQDNMVKTMEKPSRSVADLSISSSILDAPLHSSSIDTMVSTSSSDKTVHSPAKDGIVPPVLCSTSSVESARQSPRQSLAICNTIPSLDEKSMYESILLKGGVFKKYGQWGNPHRRYVWCSKDLSVLYWRPLNKKNMLTKEGIPVATMLAVLPGNSSRTRYAFMKHLSDEKSISRCFSVVAEDRRLDLEADSEATRELWMNALLFLKQNARARTLIT